MLTTVDDPGRLPPRRSSSHRWCTAEGERRCSPPARSAKRGHWRRNPMATTSATLVLLPTTTAVVPSRGGEHSADGNPHPSSTTRAAGRARRPPRPHRTRTARRFRDGGARENTCGGGHRQHSGRRTRAGTPQEGVEVVDLDSRRRSAGWTGVVGLTLQNTNTLTAEGPEIRIKPVGT